MKIIAAATAITTAKPGTVFRIWSDVEHWPLWDVEITWAKLNGPHAVGTTGALKPVNGPRTNFTVIEVIQNQSFTDVSHLPGAKLQFIHQLAQTGDMTQVTHTVSISGPLAWLWEKILGHNLRRGLQPAVQGLIKLAEKA